MKVDISEDGELVVSPESPIEAYALTMWLDDNKRFSDSERDKIEISPENIVIMTKINEE